MALQSHRSGFKTISYKTKQKQSPTHSCLSKFEQVTNLSKSEVPVLYSRDNNTYFMVLLGKCM